MRRILLALSTFAFLACSSDPVAVAETDAAADVGSPADAGKDVAPSGDATSDGSTPVDSAIPDVFIPPDAVSLSCLSPADCGDAGTPICCAILSTGAGSPPSCPIDSLTSSCKSSCTTTMNFQCNAISTVRACAQNSDCPEPTYGKCCTFTDGNSTATFCTSAGIAAAGGATCK